MRRRKAAGPSTAAGFHTFTAGFHTFTTSSQLKETKQSGGSLVTVGEIELA
jgi:hypothetical protein